MPNRAARRVRHRLTPWPRHKPMPIRGLKLSGTQRAWTCSCGSGWFSLTSDPAEGHAAHVVQMLAPEEVAV